MAVGWLVSGGGTGAAAAIHILVSTSRSLCDASCVVADCGLHWWVVVVVAWYRYTRRGGVVLCRWSGRAVSPSACRLLGKELRLRRPPARRRRRTVCRVYVTDVVVGQLSGCEKPLSALEQYGKCSCLFTRETIISTSYQHAIVHRKRGGDRFFFVCNLQQVGRQAGRQVQDAPAAIQLRHAMPEHRHRQHPHHQPRRRR
ncbi:hypothetical protein FN846DRAFT_558201 [Sphaerosporella brunnea]|uniref:Uncharacterized protein n=1 Tax=Sphaerosporella brunnea TaxID=1250544 RepID=A0A5J5EC73_9PEZI|nr:hypothetical protein FN846DRAFT_558201 [Sphaerosporella brunnea]